MISQKTWSATIALFVAAWALTVVAADKGDGENPVDSASPTEVSGAPAAATPGSETPAPATPPQGAPVAAPSPGLNEQARRAAARSSGEVIGRSIDEDVVQNWHERDHRAFLECERNALRGALLMRYAFQQQQRGTQLHGYIMANRDGRDGQGHSCRELVMDLVYQNQRYFEQPVVCQLEDGGWYEVDPNSVRFNRAGPPRRSAAPSDWLPPLPDDGTDSDGSWLPPL